MPGCRECMGLCPHHTAQVQRRTRSTPSHGRAEAIDGQWLQHHSMAPPCTCQRPVARCCCCCAPCRGDPGSSRSHCRHRQGQGAHVKQSTTQRQGWPVHDGCLDSLGHLCVAHLGSQQAGHTAGTRHVLHCRLYVDACCCCVTPASCTCSR